MPPPVARRNAQYSPGELEVVLLTCPTKCNIQYLSELLQRTPSAIKLIYRFAFNYNGRFGRESMSQRRKINEAKVRLGLVAIGRQK